MIRKNYFEFRQLFYVIFLLFISLFIYNDKLFTQVKLNSDNERKIDSIISLMTLEEKVGQMVQITGRFDEVNRGILIDEVKKLIKEGKIGSMLNVVGAEITKKTQKIAVEETRLHIPLIFGLDVIHGFRIIFPIPLAEACTWNPDLIEKAAHIAATEASASGLHWTFAPMVDIARDPRWGRIAEGSGEDPFLGSMLAAARVRGFQGNDLTSKTSIIACAKHYTAYGGAEGGRDYNTVETNIVNGPPIKTK